MHDPWIGWWQFTFLFSFAPSKARAIHFHTQFREKEPNEHVEAKAITHKFAERTIKIPIKVSTNAANSLLTRETFLTHCATLDDGA